MATATAMSRGAAPHSLLASANPSLRRCHVTSFLGHNLKGLGFKKKLPPHTLTVRAVQTEKPTYQVIEPLNGDPFIGSLETPVTSSP